MSCCNVGCFVLLPHVIFDRNTIKLELTEGKVPGTIYGFSDSVWVDSETNECYFTNHSLIYLPPSKPFYF